MKSGVFSRKKIYVNMCKHKRVKLYGNTTNGDPPDTQPAGNSPKVASCTCWYSTFSVM